MEMAKQKLNPIHPGEVLQEEFLKPFGLSENQLAQTIHVPVEQINRLIQGQFSVTADLALRLARYFDMSPQFWLGLQMDYDLDVAEDRLKKKIAAEVPVYAAA